MARGAPAGLRSGLKRAAAVFQEQLSDVFGAATQPSGSRLPRHRFGVCCGEACGELAPILSLICACARMCFSETSIETAKKLVSEWRQE